MAKAYAKCATEGCGNSILFVEQNRKLADRKAAWAESKEFICSDCEDKKRAEENAKAAAKNADAGLPALTGSEKQTPWAETIRASVLENIRKALAGEMSPMELEAYWGSRGMHGQAMLIDHGQIDYAIALLKAQTTASWWIDNRQRKVGFLLSELFIANPPAPPVEPAQQAIIEEAAIEATARPEEPKTETVAEIQYSAKSITVKFPEKRESFRLLMRKHGFEWISSAWTRTLIKRNGDPQDRAAEIGHILLGSGFIIRVYDENVRAKAISGEYAEERTRWILLYTSGAEQGRLCIHWSRDEDYYRAAKRLPTARYSKPNISVAIEQFEQVLDFAEINGFSISAEAQAAINAARKAREAALVAHVELKAKESRGDNGKPIALAVPEHVEVDDELRD